MGLYDYSSDPYTDTLLQAVYGKQIQPIQAAGMNVPPVDYPSVAVANGGGGGMDDGGMGDASSGIGSMLGSFMKGQAADAGGWSNLPRHWGSKVGIAEPIVKPTPTMLPSAGDPIGALEGMKGGLSQGTTPYGAGQAGTFIKPLMEGGAGAALPGAVTPALGPAMSLLQGKKKAAGLGTLGMLAGVPFGPVGMAAGNMLGSLFGGDE